MQEHHHNDECKTLIPDPGVFFRTLTHPQTANPHTFASWTSISVILRSVAASVPEALRLNL